MTDHYVAEQTAHLVAHFGEIAHTRMRDVALVNPRLQVDAVGFRRSADGILGVLVTPWFMSLVLLPDQRDDWRDDKVGDKHLYQMASGSFVFQSAVGWQGQHYRSCALLSPLLDVTNQAIAVGIASAALDALQNADATDDGGCDKHTAELHRRWHRECAPNSGSHSVLDAMPNAATAASKPLSRRAFLGNRSAA